MTLHAENKVYMDKKITGERIQCVSPMSMEELVAMGKAGGEINFRKHGYVSSVMIKLSADQMSVDIFDIKNISATAMSTLAGHLAGDAYAVITVVESWLNTVPLNDALSIPSGGVKDMEGTRDGLSLLLYKPGKPPESLIAKFDRSVNPPVVEPWEVMGPIGDGNIMDGWEHRDDIREVRVAELPHEEVDDEQNLNGAS